MRENLISLDRKVELSYGLVMFNFPSTVCLQAFLCAVIFATQGFAQEIELFPCLKRELNLTAAFGDSNSLRKSIKQLNLTVGPDVHHRDPRSGQLDQALSCALHYNNKDTFLVLIESGADIYFVSTKLVALNNDVLELLIEQKLHLQLILERAAYLGDIKIAKRAIENGAEVNRDKQGSLALCSAALRGHTDMVDYLISKGADVNLPNRHGDLPLHLASRLDQIDVAKLLLKNGAAINKTMSTSKENAAIHSAHSPAMIKLLLDNGADIDLQNSAGKTALINVASSNNLQLAELLINLGSNPNLKDREKTRIQRSCGGGKPAPGIYCLSKKKKS